MKANLKKVKDQTTETIRYLPHNQWVKEGAEPVVLTKQVPREVAAVCRQLARRARHGVYVDFIGGLDMLAELDLHGVRYKVESRSGRGTNMRSCWVVAEFDLAVSDQKRAT